MLRLAVRSLATRPLRTAVLAAGFGLGIAVMVELLGVGEVILQQAHAPALRGGGDLVVSGAFGPLESARFLLLNVLGSSEFRMRVTAASPSRRATLYLIKPGMVVPVASRGGIPSLEKAVGDPEVAQAPAWTDEPAEASWVNPKAGDVLRAMDRFHPIPAATPAPDTTPAPVVSGFSRTTFASSWAEWLYFNGRSADGRVRFYLTFLAGPFGAAGKRLGVVRLQLNRDGRSTNYSSAADVDSAALLEHAPDLDIAENHVRLEGTRYRITLALARERPSGPTTSVAQAPSTLVLSPSKDKRRARSAPAAEVAGEITLDAPAGRSLPPATIRGARGWISGYVVPVLSGVVGGTLQVADETISLDGATGYHDHNWGFWEGVTWQWGQVAAGDLSIVYGRVFPPATAADPERVPGFLGVLGPNGPIAFSTDVTISEDNDAGRPRAITVRARGERLNVTLALSVEESVRTRLAGTSRPGGAAMNFLQLGGLYRVRGHAGDRAIDFTSRGAAETFQPGNP